MPAEQRRFLAQRVSRYSDSSACFAATFEYARLKSSEGRMAVHDRALLALLLATFFLRLQHHFQRDIAKLAVGGGDPPFGALAASGCCTGTPRAWVMRAVDRKSTRLNSS